VVALPPKGAAVDFIVICQRRLPRSRRLDCLSAMRRVMRYGGSVCGVRSFGWKANQAQTPRGRWPLGIRGLWDTSRGDCRWSS